MVCCCDAERQRCGRARGRPGSVNTAMAYEKRTIESSNRAMAECVRKPGREESAAGRTSRTPKKQIPQMMESAKATRHKPVSLLRSVRIRLRACSLPLRDGGSVTAPHREHWKALLAESPSESTIRLLHAQQCSCSSAAIGDMNPLSQCILHSIAVCFFGAITTMKENGTSL